MQDRTPTRSSLSAAPPSAPDAAAGVARSRFVQVVDRMLGGELGGTLLLAALSGAAIAVVAWWILAALGEGAKLIYGTDDAGNAATSVWWLRLLAPAAGGLVCGLLIRFLARQAVGLDVPELIDDVGRRGGRVDLRRALVKTIASIPVIASGGSAGPEGPLVHAAGAVASGGGRLFGVEGQRLKLLVACGAAAGIAAVFGTPIAGMLFAVEVVLGAVHMRTLLPVAVAAATSAVTRHVLLPVGAYAIPVLSVPSAVGWLGAESIALCLVLGIAGGIVGGLFTRSLSLCEEIFGALPLPSWLAPALGGLLVGAMGLVMPGVLGHGYGALHGLAVTGPAAIALTASFIAWKLLATSITVGSGGAGGIFMPALLMGGALGAVCSAGAAALGAGSLHDLAPSYVLLGAAAVLAGTTHAALTATVLVFEATLEPVLVLPGLLATGASVVVASLLTRDTIHTLSLRRHGGRSRRPVGEASVLHETPVSALVRTDVERIGRGEPLAKLVRRVLEGGAMNQHVVDENGKLLGSVSLQEVGPLLREDGVEGLLLAYDVMRQPPVSVLRADSLSTCLERFARVDADELPVVDGSGVLIGRVTRKDVLSFYAREVLGGRELGMKFIARTDRTAPATGSSPDSPSEVVTGFVEVPPDHKIEALTVPPGFIGRSLKELSIRSRFGVEVISMRRRTLGGGRISLVAPDPNLPLREGDVLVLAGPSGQIEKLQKLVGSNAT
jgi:CIC family chloride channel protein